MTFGRFLNAAGGRARSRLRPDGWSLGVTAMALALALPVLVVASFVVRPAGEVWRHLAATMLAEYVTNSVLLLLGVGAGALSWGSAPPGSAPCVAFPAGGSSNGRCCCP